MRANESLQAGVAGGESEMPGHQIYCCYSSFSCASSSWSCAAVAFMAGRIKAWQFAVSASPAAPLRPPLRLSGLGLGSLRLRPLAFAPGAAAVRSCLLDLLPDGNSGKTEAELLDTECRRDPVVVCRPSTGTPLPVGE
jgi:hypothetical protein